MWSRDLVAIAVTLGVTIASSVPIGHYVARVFQGQRTWLDPLCGPIERLLLSLLRLDVRQTQTWTGYTRSLLVSNAVMWLAALTTVTAQGWLPLNPDAIGGMTPSLAFNTASSFVTNTNLQHYSGETGLSTFSQMAMVTFLQFVSAATGMAALAAVIRALAGSRLTQVGHFYVDAIRASVRVLLPLALVVGVLGLWQGIPMTFGGAVRATTLEGETQTIARGVVAAEVAIKQLGTNGGGYFGPNSAHPFENPTPLTNVVQTWAIAVLPMAMVWTLGAMTGRRRLAAVLFVTMLALYVPLLGVAWWSEAQRSPAIAALGVDQAAGATEGKEVRVGAAMSAMWVTTTTATSNGSVDAMHDSLTPLAGLVALTGMWLNTIFGGVGVGFINLLVYVVVAVFVAGMMIGRTPELLGKKVEPREMQLASLTLLLHPALILAGTAAACAIWAATADPATALAWLKNRGPARLQRDALRVHLGRRQQRVRLRGARRQHRVLERDDRDRDAGRPLRADRGAAGPRGVARGQGRRERLAGSLGIDSATFGVTLWAVIVILGLLMFLPTAVLGPIAEHLAA